MQDNKRDEPRAPINGFIVLGVGPKIFKSHTLNISESGILFEGVEDLEVDSEVFLMFDLPVIKDFSLLKPEKLFSLEKEDFQRSVIRLKGRVIRQFEGKNPLGEGEVKQTAVEFTDIAQELKEHISKYVIRFKKNLELLLHDIEELGKTNQHSKRLKKVSNLLGYGEVHKISILRQRVTHHYRGLQ
ncbi:MAG: PilZ domain-containing protein [Bacteriovoracaceae bacterium]